MARAKVEWYNRKGMKVLRHIVAWAIVLALPYLLDNQHGTEHHDDATDKAFFYLNFLTSFCWVPLFYGSAYYLTPRFLYSQRYVNYISTLVISLGFIWLVHGLLYSRFFGLPHFNMMGSLMHLVPAFVLTVAVSVAYRLVHDKMRTEEETLQTELSFLRSQINPHFIFNILNNLVALERIKSDELGPTILKLSSLMQYMLYDTEEENVELELEVEYLQSYIDLQRQRFGEKVKIHVDMEIQENRYRIEPMLLIPFVENAFKHGVGLIDKPEINIRLYTRDGGLYFTASNKYNPGYEEVKDKTSGIGLANVKRRLHLLYGTQHSLRRVKDDRWFTVSLQLNLH